MKSEKKALPSTVKEMFEWKNNSNKENKKKGWPETVEKQNTNYTDMCGGMAQTDVLFSFLGIYAIGVYVYRKEFMKERFRIVNRRIEILKDDVIIKDGEKQTSRPKPNRTNWSYYWRILRDESYLNEIQSQKDKFDVEELNEDIKALIEVYFSAGNLIPIWPGGNISKGRENMDLPHIFFKNNIFWFERLRNHELAFLDDLNVEDEKYKTLNRFLENMNNKENYKKFINEIVEIIIKRTKLLLN